MTEKPPVWILLINWNTPNDTIECLESLLRQDYSNYRIVLCDNGSTDGSIERILGWAAGREVPALTPPPELHDLVEPRVPKPVQAVRLDRAAAEAGSHDDARDPAPLILIDVGQNAGFCGGTNIALRYAMAQRRPGYVWLVNNDMVVARDALSRLVSFAQRNPDVGAVGGGILEYKAPDVIQIQGGGHASLWTGFPSATRAAGKRHGAPGTDVPELDFIAYGCLLAPLSAIERVGMLSERYFLYCEDIDHSLRMRRAGYRLAYDADAIVWHKGGATVGYRSPRHDFYMARNTLLLVALFAPWRLPVAFVYSLYRCVLGKLVRGEWSRLGAVFRAYMSFAREAWPSRDGERETTDRMIAPARQNAT